MINNVISASSIFRYNSTNIETLDNIEISENYFHSIENKDIYKQLIENKFNDMDIYSENEPIFKCFQSETKRVN